MKRFTALIISTITLLLACLAPAVPALAATNVFGGACSVQGAGGSPVCDKSVQSGNPVATDNGIIVKVANVIALVTGIVAVIMIIISGFMYVVSGGDSSKVNTARATLLYSVVGVVIVVLARTIVIFVANKL